MSRRTPILALAALAVLTTPSFADRECFENSCQMPDEAEPLAAAPPVEDASPPVAAPDAHAKAPPAPKPVVQMPVVETPAVQPAVVQAPVVRVPVAVAPVARSPVAQAPQAQAPQAQAAAPINTGPQMEVDASPHPRLPPLARKLEHPAPRQAEAPRIQRYPVAHVAPREPVQQVAPQVAPRVAEQPRVQRYPVQQVAPRVVEEPRAPARVVNQGPDHRRIGPAPRYVVNQGGTRPVHEVAPGQSGPAQLAPAYAGSPVVNVAVDGVVAVYPALPPDPAWKRCQDNGRPYRCSRHSYHPYGEHGYRPYGTYQSYSSVPVYAVAPNARIIELDTDD